MYNSTLLYFRNIELFQTTDRRLKITQTAPNVQIREYDQRIIPTINFALKLQNVTQNTTKSHITINDCDIF